MIKRALWLGLVGLMISAATPGLAAEGAHGEGAWEISLTSDFDQGFSPSVAYYVINNLALTVQGRYAKAEEDESGVGTTDVTHTSFGAGLEYNIPTGSAIVPFLGIVWLYGSEDEDASGTANDHEANFSALEYEGGVKLMIGERSSVNLIVSYLTGSRESTTGGAADPDIDVTDLSLGLGYSLYFY